MTFTSASTVRYFLDGAGGTPVRPRSSRSGRRPSRGAARGRASSRTSRPTPHTPDGLRRGAGGRRARLMRPVTLLTDYGTADEFAGVLHAVIARIAPDARVIDLASRDPAPGRRRAARWCWSGRCPSRPPASTWRSSTRASAGRGARSRCAPPRRTGCWSGRTTGCSCPPPRASAASRRRSRSRASPWRLEPVSATFHGRDLFAPVAARLAAGARARARRARRWMRRTWSRSSSRAREVGETARRAPSPASTASATSPSTPHAATSPPAACGRATTCACGRVPGGRRAGGRSARAGLVGALRADVRRRRRSGEPRRATRTRPGSSPSRSTRGDAAAALGVAAGDRVELAPA